jgi:hypothetical protein
MTKWGLFKTLALIIVAFFLASGIFTNYAGHEYWQTDRAGIFAGIIHGILAPLMLVVAIFTDYGVYELNNIGWFYDLGFIMGILFTWSGGKSNTQIVKNYYDKKQAEKQENNQPHKKLFSKIKEKFSKNKNIQENKINKDISKTKK